MEPADAELLQRARDELYSLRTVVAPLRNRAATAVAALTDAEGRIDVLIEQLELRLNGSLRPKEAPGHDRAASTTQGYEQERVG